MQVGTKARQHRYIWLAWIALIALAIAPAAATEETAQEADKRDEKSASSESVKPAEPATAEKKKQCAPAAAVNTIEDLQAFQGTLEALLRELSAEAQTETPAAEEPAVVWREVPRP